MLASKKEGATGLTADTESDTLKVVPFTGRFYYVHCENCDEEGYVTVAHFHRNKDRIQCQKCGGRMLPRDL